MSRTGIVLGVANARSIAWGVVSSSLLGPSSAFGKVLLGVEPRNVDNVRSMVEKHDNPSSVVVEIFAIDFSGVSDAEFSNAVKKGLGDVSEPSVDFVLHSVAKGLFMRVLYLRATRAFLTRFRISTQRSSRRRDFGLVFEFLPRDVVLVRSNVPRIGAHLEAQRSLHSHPLL